MHVRRRSCYSFRSFDGGRGAGIRQRELRLSRLAPRCGCRRPALHLPIFIATVLWIRSCFSSLFLQMKLLTYSDILMMPLCPEFLLLSFQGVDLWIIPNWNNKTFNSPCCFFLALIDIFIMKKCLFLFYPRHIFSWVIDPIQFTYCGLLL